MQRRRRMPEERRKKKRRRKPAARLSEAERAMISLALVNVLSRMVTGILSGRSGHCASCAVLADASTGAVSCVKPKCQCHSRAARMQHGCPFHGAGRHGKAERN